MATRSIDRIERVERVSVAMTLFCENAKRGDVSDKRIERVRRPSPFHRGRRCRSGGPTSKAERINQLPTTKRRQRPCRCPLIRWRSAQTRSSIHLEGRCLCSVVDCERGGGGEGRRVIGYTKAVSLRGKREKARNNKRLVRIFVQIACSSSRNFDVHCDSSDEKSGRRKKWRIFVR